MEALSDTLSLLNTEKQLLVKVIKAAARTERQARDDRGPDVAGSGKRSQLAFISNMVQVSPEERAVLHKMKVYILYINILCFILYINIYIHKHIYTCIHILYIKVLHKNEGIYVYV